MLSDLTNREPPNTPVFQDHSQPGLDMVQLKQSLVKLIHDGYSSAGSFAATEPIQPCFASNEQEENVQVPSGIDSNRPICTTPDDSKSSETWAFHAPTPRFKTVVETYVLPAIFSFWSNIIDTGPSWDKEACKYKIAEPAETRSDLDDFAETKHGTDKRRGEIKGNGLVLAG